MVLISGFGTLETAIEAVRAGAFDYISKPFDIAEIKRIIDRALQQGVRQDDPPAEMPAGATGTLVGRTAPMLDVYKQIAYAADSSAPVLIVGESGVGKELVAQAIHSHSRRAREPFVAINCGAIADTLLESELFGHQRGAFTGAVVDHKGVFEQAGEGTVLLDEIGDTTPALQVRMLRVLEEGEARPVGGNRSLRVAARVIAATNVALEQAVADGRFRQICTTASASSSSACRAARTARRHPAADRQLSRRGVPARRTADAVVGRRARGADAPSVAGVVRELANTIERLVVSSRAG